MVDIKKKYLGELLFKIMFCIILIFFKSIELSKSLTGVSDAQCITTSAFKLGKFLTKLDWTKDKYLFFYLRDFTIIYTNCLDFFFENSANSLPINPETPVIKTFTTI